MLTLLASPMIFPDPELLELKVIFGETGVTTQVNELGTKFPEALSLTKICGLKLN